MKTLIIILFPFLSFSQLETQLITKIYQEDSPAELLTIAKKNKLKIYIDRYGATFENKFFRIYKDIDGNVFFFMRYSSWMFKDLKKELDLNHMIIGGEVINGEAQMIYENDINSQWELASFKDGDKYLVYALTKK